MNNFDRAQRAYDNMTPDEPEEPECPEQGDANITRFSCLDYSGHPDHHETCRRCERYTTNRMQAVPK
jgi:hypothetical protein